MTMRAAWYERKGPARDVLVVGELPKPSPGPGEVLVAVKASGVNPSDTKGRSGARGNTAMPFPLIIPHQDGAGIIEAVGDGVPRARIGEGVWIYEAQLGRAFGTAAGYVAVPAANAVPMPDGLGFVEAACLGVPALTAHRCVFADGPVAGQTVLVTGGAGAVGFYAVQFAKHGGARVIATVRGDAQADTARRAGADLVIDRTRDDVFARAGRVDRIVEVAFGANLETSVRMLNRNGVIATYSSDAEPAPTIPFWPLVMLDATVRFVLVYAMTAAAHAEAIEATNQAAREGWLQHHVGATLPLDRIADAHELVESGRAGGKVVVEPLVQ
ncbi:MAG: NADPH:quinone reductase [Vicinamibacterales bacterium]|nr:NADPH:quinone reductase [Vicinamibacterales bacterium]